MDFLHKKRKLRRTTMIICWLSAFIAGLGMARTNWTINGSLVILSLAFVVVSLRRPRNTTTICLIIFGVALGWWRGQTFMTRLQGYDLLYGKKLSVVGTADTDAIYGKNTQLTFDLTNLQVTSPYNQKLVGKISVKGFGTPAVYKGDKVAVSGKLYPTRGSRQASISFAKLNVTTRSDSVIEKARRKFQAGMLSALPEPLASFALGLLIGQRNTLPDNITNQLSAVGLTHVVAVSGYNLTIIMGAVYLLLKKRSKYQSTVLSFLLIGLFLLFTGLSPSFVRAAIVSGLTLIATFYGRKIRPLMILLIAAALTAGWYPIYIWSDIGWYLSFLAFFGVLIIAPLVVKRIYKAKQPRLVASAVIETLSAQLMALPLIMFIFGEISLIALPANIMIVPLVPLAMLLSFIASLAGMFVPTVSGWFAWPARIILTYMLDMISLMSKVPHALSNRSISLTELIAFYVIVLLVILALWHKIKQKNVTITDRKQKLEYERT